MERGYSNYWDWHQWEPRFDVPNMQNQSFWTDRWDQPECNNFPDRPPPWIHGNNFNNCNIPDQGRGWKRSRGYFNGTHPYRGHYRRSKRSFPKERGCFQNSSHSSCLIDTMPSKKENDSKKVEKPTAASESKKSQEDSTNLVKKTDTPEVTLKDSQASEDPPSQTVPVSFEQAPSETAEGLPTIEKEDPIQVELKDSQAAEDPPSQTLSVLSAEASTEEQIPPETTEGVHPTEKEPVLLEASPPKDHFSHANAPLAAEIPFLSETTDDHHSEGKENIELTQIASSHEDADHQKATVVQASSSSSLPSTLSDVCVVPVLVREEKNDLPYPWENASFQAGNSWGWAPEDCQEPPCIVSEVGKRDKVSEYDSSLVQSQSPLHSFISCHQKCDTGILLEYHSCSPKSQRSSESKHSNTKRTSMELHPRSSRSPHRPEWSSWSRDRSSHSCSPKSRHSSNSKHSSTNRTSRELCIQNSRSPHKRKQPHHSRDKSPHSYSLKSRHSSNSKHSSTNRASKELHIQSSRFPHRQKQSHWRQDCSPQRRRELNIQTADYSYCHCEYCSNPYQKNFCERDSPSFYFASKRNCHCSLEERGKLCKAPHPYSPESPTEKKKLRHPEKMEKKKKTATAGKATKSTKTKKKAKGGQADGAPILSETAQKLRPVRTAKSELTEMAASSENTGSPPHPYAGEKDGSLSSSRTSEDRSAAILARKEEIEEAYQRVLLNFAAVATMLLKTKPCMEEAMEAALRTNLRRIGNYYECMLKNFIDSYDLADAS
ncbi:serine/arginine repetitive matrix protein 5-like isoform X2 [Rhineura floridana]|uniref:serine/arginine repetitive matrix protein 5-like isoform X2 n=1 Tax=Rhineura floridana TaxID=261503 RepID=UPI002AC842F0|nr:serine/arginine repetitive matrix protein 5-like isoform X2 [Rhineura floridana]